MSLQQVVLCFRMSLQVVLGSRMSLQVVLGSRMSLQQVVLGFRMSLQQVVLGFRMSLHVLQTGYHAIKRTYLVQLYFGQSFTFFIVLQNMYEQFSKDRLKFKDFVLIIFFSVWMCTSIITLNESNDKKIVVQHSKKLLGFVFLESMKLY